MNSITQLIWFETEDVAFVLQGWKDKRLRNNFNATRPTIYKTLTIEDLMLPNTQWFAFSLISSFLKLIGAFGFALQFYLNLHAIFWRLCNHNNYFIERIIIFIPRYDRLPESSLCVSNNNFTLLYLNFFWLFKIYY